MKQRRNGKPHWERNEQKWHNRQAKLKHYVATGEWKNFNVEL